MVKVAKADHDKTYVEMDPETIYQHLYMMRTQMYEPLSIHEGIIAERLNMSKFFNENFDDLLEQGFSNIALQARMVLYYRPRIQELCRGTVSVLNILTYILLLFRGCRFST